MLTINLEFKAPATNVVHDVLAVLKNAEIVALFVAIFVLGNTTKIILIKHIFSKKEKYHT